MDEVVGLIPAAGSASRLGALPCSKEIFPVGEVAGAQGEIRPKAVGEYLLEAMAGAGIQTAYIVLRDGKWDIPAYLGHGAWLGLDLAYLIAGLPYGTPYTLDQAYPFVSGRRVALGFPDIVFRPWEAFARLLHRQDRTGAEVVLGLFPAERPSKMDMVAIDSHGRVTDIQIKPATTELRFTWIIAVWGPAFTHYMHRYLAAHLERVRAGRFPQGGVAREPFVGDVVRAALDDGLEIQTVSFEQGECIDVGTLEDLAVASRRLRQ